MEKETLILFSAKQNLASLADIHPAATIGKGIILHATGIVIGETSVIEDDVSIFRVTLGGTGKEIGDEPQSKEGSLNKFRS